MNSCPERRGVQDYLDQTLDAGAATAFRAHLAGCAECAAELALYRRVFEVLAAAPTWDPGAALTERVLAQVLPSQVRRRRLAALGWGYAGSLAAVLAMVGVLGVRPGAWGALEALSGEASRRLLQSGVFLLNSFTHASMRLAEGWGLVTAAGELISPLQRALAAVLSQPAVALTVWASAAVCVGVLWWMRPRARTTAGGGRHVAVLGF